MITNRTPAPTRRRSIGGLTGYEELEAIQAKKERVHDEADAILKRATDANRDLTAAEARKTEALLGELDSLRRQERQTQAKLKNARQVEAEEAEATRRAGELRPNPHLPEAHQREHVVSLDSSTRVDFGSGCTTAVTSFGAGGNYRDTENVWTYRNTNEPAVIRPGQNWQDHAEVQRANATDAERDRLILGTYGDFGQYVRAMTTTGTALKFPELCPISGDSIL